MESGNSRMEVSRNGDEIGKNLWRILRPVLLNVFLGAAVAFVTPEDILNYQWASAFVSAVGALVPVIGTVPATYTLQGVVQFDLAKVWCLLPVTSAACFRAVMRHYPPTSSGRVRLLARLERFKRTMPIHMFIIGPVVLYFLFFTQLDGSIAHDRAILGSRLGLVFSYNLGVTGEAFFVAICLAWVKLVPQLYLGKAH